MRTIAALAVLAFAVATGSSGQSVAKNLIVNGSFEQSSARPGSYQDLAAGSTAIAGWTVTLKHIDYIGGLWPASDGKYSIDLEGSKCNTSSQPDCLGGIKQTFATVKGQKYDVAVDLSGNAYSGPKVKTLKVSAGAESHTFNFDITGHGGRNMGWKTEHWTFTATGATTALELASADNTAGISGWGPVIDNVRVTPSAAK